MNNDELINEIIECAESQEGQLMADDILAKLKSGEIKAPTPVVDLREQDILKVLKVSYIAERFFGRSRSWLCHKINHDMMNGKPDDFTDAERRKLKEALDTIAFEIQTLSDSM